MGWHGGVILHDGEGRAKAVVLSNEAARSWMEVCIVVVVSGRCDERSEVGRMKCKGEFGLI